MIYGQPIKMLCDYSIVCMAVLKIYLCVRCSFVVIFFLKNDTRYISHCCIEFTFTYTYINALLACNILFVLFYLLGCSSL